MDLVILLSLTPSQQQWLPLAPANLDWHSSSTSKTLMQNKPSHSAGEETTCLNLSINCTVAPLSNSISALKSPSKKWLNLVGKPTSLLVILVIVHNKLIVNTCKTFGIQSVSWMLCAQICLFQNNKIHLSKAPNQTFVSVICLPKKTDPSFVYLNLPSAVYSQCFSAIQPRGTFEIGE